MPKLRKCVAASAAQPIEVGLSYNLSDFMRRTGLGRYAIREARKNGLKIVYTAGRAYVRGVDWHDYLGRQLEGAQGEPTGALAAAS